MGIVISKNCIFFPNKNILGEKDISIASQLHLTLSVKGRLHGKTLSYYKQTIKLKDSLKRAIRKALYQPEKALVCWPI